LKSRRLARLTSVALAPGKDLVGINVVTPRDYRTRPVRTSPDAYLHQGQQLAPQSLPLQHVQHQLQRRRLAPIADPNPVAVGQLEIMPRA
jgi:hypothetical protein